MKYRNPLFQRRHSIWTTLYTSFEVVVVLSYSTGNLKRYNITYLLRKILRLFLNSIIQQFPYLFYYISYIYRNGHLEAIISPVVVVVSTTSTIFSSFSS